ncbi:MAG: plastocyanin [Glaciecola sp.]|jgi:plastocyanin
MISNARRLATTVLAAGFLATACGSNDTIVPLPAADATGAAPASGEVAAGIKDFLFAPDAIAVTVGTTITWTNQDRFGHTVTGGTPQDINSDFDLILGLTTDKDTTGETGSYTFETSGTFEYFCRYHPSMVGTVTVN